MVGDGRSPLRLAVINRETGEQEAELRFWPSEVDLPGYIEHLERGYEGTPWRTERRLFGGDEP